MVTRLVAVVAEVLAAEPRMEPVDELLFLEVLRVEVVFFVAEVLRDEPPAMRPWRLHMRPVKQIGPSAPRAI